MYDIMQNRREKKFNNLFEQTYKALCRENNTEPMWMVQMYLPKDWLRFCADEIVNLKDWSLILNTVMQDRELLKISVYSRCRRKKIREKIDTEEKLAKLRIYPRKDQQRPILYTNFLLRWFIDSIAVCLKNSLMINVLTLDGIPMTYKYLKILCDGLAKNRNLRCLSLAKCRIGDEGCSLLLETLQRNSRLRTLNLSSCCLTNRSAFCLTLFLKQRKVDLLQDAWKESTLSQDKDEGLKILKLNRNYKLGDIGLRQLIGVLKNDFWLKTLCLRQCGITKHGGESLLELLHTNSVLMEIDLRENEITSDQLQTIRKILKRRKTKVERISVKKGLFNHKPRIAQTSASNSRLCQRIAAEKMSTKIHTINSNSPLPIQRNSNVQIRLSTYARKTRRKKGKKRSLRNTIVKKAYVKHNNAEKLKKRLSFMIERNQDLMATLENNIDFLRAERNFRLYAEKAYYKTRSRCERLRNQISMHNSIYSNIYYENQIYKNLQSVLSELTTIVNNKKQDVLKRDIA